MQHDPVDDDVYKNAQMMGIDPHLPFYANPKLSFDQRRDRPRIIHLKSNLEVQAMLRGER